MDEELIGTITHYFGKAGVGVVKITSGELKVGDKIKVKGKSGEEKVEQEVNSMQIEHEPVEAIKKGDEAGIKMSEPVKEGDEVYKIIE